MDFHPRMQRASQNSIIEVLRCIGLYPWNLQAWHFQAKNPQFSPLKAGRAAENFPEQLRIRTHQFQGIGPFIF